MNNRVRHIWLWWGLLLAGLAPGSMAWAQNEGNIWYFGDEAGIDFNSGAPVALTNGAISTFEGCSSISSEQGDLLFYTDGITIFNRNHVPMANGTGLMGDPSASQSGVAVKVPGTFDRYLVFSVDNDGGSDGLRYSVVDMSLAGGLGAVTVKNIPLIQPVTEKVTAVLHRNELDIWVIAHGWNDNAFHAFLITPSGVTGPVTSYTGVPHTGSLGNARGCMKASPDGKSLAVAITDTSLVQLFDFDDSTGVVSNPVDLPNIPGAFGIEFSDNGKLMYVSTADITPGELFQFQVDAGSPAAINASRTFIAKTASLAMGALQIGPDRRIYCARFGGASLGVIEFPNVQGAACNYIDNGFFLMGKTSQLGLPTFVQSYFLPPQAGFNYTLPCLGDSTRFSGKSSLDSVDWWWDFGDPASGAFNHDSTQITAHLYTNPGNYTVTLIISKDSLADTISYEVSVYDYPQIDIGPPDTIICEDPSFTLDAGPGAGFYLWSTGETTRSITVYQDGLYFIEAGNGPCRVSDSIHVDFRPRPYVDLGADRRVCEGEEPTWNAGNPGADYLWSTGDTLRFLTPARSGQYWVQVTTGKCVERDTVSIEILPLPLVDLGADRSLCRDFIDLKVPAADAVLWSTGQNDNQVRIRESGTFWVEVREDICTARDTIRINLYEPVRFDLGKDLVLCPPAGDSIYLFANALHAAVSWSTGDTTHGIYIHSPGIYSVSGISPDGCTGQAEVEVGEDCPPALHIPNAFTPNGDGINDEFWVNAQNLEDFEVQIYDRWGNLIFRSSDPNFRWNGTFSGQAWPEGSYTVNLLYRQNGKMEQMGVSLLLFR